MKRRALLASVGMGVSTGLAGCFGGGGGGNDNQQTETRAGPSTPTGTPLGEEAQLSLRQIDAPPQAEIQVEYSFRIHVRNSGGQPGVYTAPVTVRRSGETEYQQVTEALVYVEPGETQVATITIPGFSGSGGANIRLGSPQNQWRVNIVGPELTYGEEFVLPGNMPLRINRVEFAQNNGGTGPAGQEVTPPNEQQYVFVYIEVQNQSGSEDYIPGPETFFVQYQDVEYSPTFLGGDGKYHQTIIPAGSTYRGWLPYLLPESASPGDLTVKYTSGGTSNSLIAYWMRGSATGDSGSRDGGSTPTTTSQG